MLFCLGSDKKVGVQHLAGLAGLGVLLADEIAESPCESLHVYIKFRADRQEIKN